MFHFVVKKPNKHIFLPIVAAVTNPKYKASNHGIDSPGIKEKNKTQIISHIVRPNKSVKNCVLRDRNDSFVVRESSKIVVGSNSLLESELLPFDF